MIIETAIIVSIVEISNFFGVATKSTHFVLGAERGFDPIHFMKN